MKDGFQEGREEPLRNKSFQTISKRLCECWLLIGQKKSFVCYSVQSANGSFGVTFVCSYTAFVVSAILIYTREPKKVGKAFRMSERKLFQDRSGDLGLADHKLRKYWLVFLCDALAAVLHTRLVRVVKQCTQWGKMPAENNISNVHAYYYFQYLSLNNKLRKLRPTSSHQSPIFDLFFSFWILQPTGICPHCNIHPMKIKQDLVTFLRFLEVTAHLRRQLGACNLAGINIIN